MRLKSTLTRFDSNLSESDGSNSEGHQVGHVLVVSQRGILPIVLFGVEHCIHYIISHPVPEFKSTIHLKYIIGYN